MVLQMEKGRGFISGRLSGCKATSLLTVQRLGWSGLQLLVAALCQEG